MAIYWPTLDFKGRKFKLCVLTRWDCNFCVRSSPLRGQSAHKDGIGHTTVNSSEVLTKNSSKNGEKMLLASGRFEMCENERFFRPFSVSRLEMHVRCNNQYKIGADGRTILGQPKLFECMGIGVLIPAHDCEMRGSLFYLLIVKYLFHRFCFNSATVY